MEYRVFVRTSNPTTDIFWKRTETWVMVGKFTFIGSNLEAAYDKAAELGMIEPNQQVIVTPAVPRSWRTAPPPREWIRHTEPHDGPETLKASYRDDR